MALLSRAAYPLHAPGGMERAVYHLARSLQARGAQTVLLTRPPVAGAGTFPGEVVTVPWSGHEGAGHGRVLDRVRHYPRFAERLGEAAAALVRQGRVDVVDAQGLTALGYARRRRRDPGLHAPLVMNPQGMEEHRTTGVKRFALLPLRRLSREAARLADRVIATDESTRADVTTLLGVPPERVVVIPNGVDPAEIEAATPADARAVASAALPSLSGAAPLLVAVGRLEPYKGFGDVIDAAARIHATGALGSAWRLVIVGPGPDRARLERLAAPLGPHVVFAGQPTETLLHALYASADVFVHGTRFEGSSLVTLEAMAHGLPVVATRAGGIPDKVVEGVTGRLVEPGDVPALADALRDVLADPERRRAMGAAGRERVRAQFVWSAIVDRVLALYGSLGVAVPA